MTLYIIHTEMTLNKFGLVFWHINHSYLILNPVSTYTKYMICKHIFFFRYIQLKDQTVPFLTIQFSINQLS